MTKAKQKIKFSAGKIQIQIVENAGPRAYLHSVDLFFDGKSVELKVGKGRRKLSKSEALLALDEFKSRIIKSKWPVA